ncbi:MAG: ATPase domain-containing protein [Rhodanobacteraceae bacterium]
MSNVKIAPHPKAATGVPGLDDVLAGGLTEGNVFLLEGSPGTGKTTIAMRFLLAGAEIGERGLYITLSETESELRAFAASLGWRMGEHIDIYELVPPENLMDEAQRQTLLYSADLELGETTRSILEQVERTKPQRVAIDSLSEIRLLAQSSLRQILALKHYFKSHGATVLLLDDLTSEARDKTAVHSVAGSQPHARIRFGGLVRCGAAAHRAGGCGGIAAGRIHASRSRADRPRVVHRRH